GTGEIASISPNAARVWRLKVAVIFHTVYVMKQFPLRAFWLAALICSGCSKSAVPAESRQQPVADPGAPTQAQPKLQTMKIYVGVEEMVAELALSFDEQRTGMMFRTNMPENAGMLFPLPYTQPAAFWMKNCPLPLSAAYIDPEGVIQEIHDLRPFN